MGWSRSRVFTSTKKSPSLLPARVRRKTKRGRGQTGWYTLPSTVSDIPRDIYLGRTAADFNSSSIHPRRVQRLEDTLSRQAQLLKRECIWISQFLTNYVLSGGTPRSAVTFLMQWHNRSRLLNESLTTKCMQLK